MAYSNVSVASTATLIVAENTQRKSLIIVNNDPDTVVYIGPNTSITTSNAVPLYENQHNDWIKGLSEHYHGPVYGIVSTGTADVRYWEITQ